MPLYFKFHIFFYNTNFWSLNFIKFTINKWKYTNYKASGNVDNTDEYKNYTATVDIDYEKSLELLKIFNTQTSVPVE